MAGLLTYSGNRGLPNRHNQWLSVFSEPFLEFTAAGLFGIHTRFPFHCFIERDKSKPITRDKVISFILFYNVFSKKSYI